MRLGITVDSLAPHLTGIGRYTWELCQGLAADPAINDLAYFLNDHWVSNPAGLVAGTARRRSRLPRVLRKPAMRSGFKSRLVHGTNYFLPEMADTGVITVHDLSIYVHPETHPPGRIRDFERLFASSLARAVHVVVDSEATRIELISLFNYPGAKVTNVHLGVSDRFRPQARLSLDADLRRILGRSIDEYVLSVATFEPRKRIDAAVHAHAAFCDRTGSKVPLVLVGAKGWANEELHALITSEERKGRLIMLGFVAEPDLPALYAGASVFLYPSIYEGFGLPPIEAMACGVPTIVSNRSCLPEVTRGAAMMVDPDDLDALSAAIERALADDIWRDGAIAAGITVAAHYSWKRCVEKTIDVYRTCSIQVD